MHLFKQGIEPLSYLLDAEIKATAKAKQDENLKDFSDPWTEIVGNWLDTKPKMFQYARQRAVTALLVLNEALGMHLSREIDQRAKVRVSRVMRDLGWAMLNPAVKTCFTTQVTITMKIYMIFSYKGCFYNIILL
jgi:hypothetical protein